MIKPSFKGIRVDGYFYKRSASTSRRSPDGVRVRTFGAPVSAAVFVSSYVNTPAASSVYADDSELGRLRLVNKDGRLAPGALDYLSDLLGADELALLTMFGVRRKSFRHSTRKARR